MSYLAGWEIMVTPSIFRVFEHDGFNAGRHCACSLLLGFPSGDESMSGGRLGGLGFGDSIAFQQFRDLLRLYRAYR